jgi:hypothetical protein
MEVGDSFALPFSPQVRGNIATTITRFYIVVDRKKKFSLRKYNNPETGELEIRCWRIK